MTNHEGTAEKSRFRWLDRWLEPRWRALLTWVVLAATSMGIQRVLSGAAAFWMSAIGFDRLRFYFPAGLISPQFADNSVTMFCLCWFQPLCLRVGVWRWIAWVFASTIVAELIRMTEIWHGLNQDLGGEVIALGNLFGIPGLVTVGVRSRPFRSRPWMSMIGGALATTFVSYFRFSGLTWIGLFVGSNAIYGAVMLYGTDPLPRRPADERP